MSLNSSPPTSPPAEAPKSRSADASERVKGLWTFTGRYRTLHLTWFAFFLTFVVWFSFAPFATTIKTQLGLSTAQVATIGLCNVALTVPARIFVGMALDRWGPRRVFSTILIYAAIPNTIFAFSSSASALIFSRLALSIVGAGFVVGIRLVAEWFPPKEVGTAEGVYGGWGNFGSAAAAFTLPTVATIAAFITGGENGWRLAIFTVGLISAAYGVFFFKAIQDTPDGVRFARPKRQGALEVTNRRAVFGLAAVTTVLNMALIVIAWRVWRAEVISTTVLGVVAAIVFGMTTLQVVQVFRVNGAALRNEYPQAEQYPFRSVVVLCAAYFATFGSELAVVTMLPGFFEETWQLSATVAGVAGSTFAFMNLASRPVGGIMSDIFGSRKKTLAILLVGLIVGYGGLTTVGSSWAWGTAIVVVMVCSFFVQAGEGAVFAIVPLVKKSVSGQIAGLTGAAGNVGAICFLTIRLLLIDRANASTTDGFAVADANRIFFLLIGGTAVIALALSWFLVEPADSFSAKLATDDEFDLEDNPTGADASDARPERVPVAA